MSLPHPDNILASGVTRRTAISSALAAAGGALAFPQSVSLAGQPASQETRLAAPKRYDMKKSINLWAFPYPDHMLGRVVKRDAAAGIAHQHHPSYTAQYLAVERTNRE